MKKDLLIIDVQTHYTASDTRDYVNKLNDYLKENKDSINRINLVIDLMHEDNGDEFFFEEIYDKTGGCDSEYLFYEITEELQEKHPQYIQTFSDYVIKDRLPMDLARSLIVLKHKGVEINRIEKWYGGLRDIIDNDIESLAYYTKLIFELDKIGIDAQMIDEDELLEVMENNESIKIIVESFISNIGLEFEDIATQLCDIIRVNVEFELEKYSDLLNTDLPLHAVGGGTMECFFEEAVTLLSVQDIVQGELNLVVENDLVYGNTDHIEYEWLEGLSSEQILNTELSSFQNKIKEINNLLYPTSKLKKKRNINLR